MRHATWLLLVLVVAGCTSTPGAPRSEPDPAVEPSPAVWYQDLAYALEAGGTLELRTGAPQAILASDWSLVSARPLDIAQSDSGSSAQMRIWIDDSFQQVRRDTLSCVDGQCNVFFDYVTAGTPAPPMLVPRSQLANLTWTEEDTRQSTAASPGSQSIVLTRYGSLPTRPAGWAWTGWQGSIGFDNESRPLHIDLTTIMPQTGALGTWTGTLTRAQSSDAWPRPLNATRHVWAMNTNPAAPWFPGFEQVVPGRDFTLEDAHDYVLGEHEAARQAHDAQCTVKVGLGLVDGASSSVTPLDLGSQHFESQNTQVSFGFPDDAGIAVWAVVRSEADTVRPARYEDGGSAVMEGVPRCDEFGTRAGALPFYDFSAWAQDAVHGREADSVHLSWHDTSYHGRLATGTRLTASFGPVDPEGAVGASYAVLYYPNTWRMGGDLMPEGCMQALDAGTIPRPALQRPDG